MPKVSVIIPVYNAESYLKQCLDSVINQTFKDIEIIVVNDCSLDNSLQIIKEYQLKDSRIVLIDFKKNREIGFTRNEGLKIAKGKYITFVDSDDWIRQDYIEILFNNIEKYKCDVFVESFKIYNNVDKTYIDYRYSNFIIKYKNYKNLLLFPIQTCYVWSKIYNSKYLKTNKLFFLLKQYEDILFFYKLILSKPKIIFDNKPIYFYRISREKSLSNNVYFKIHALLKLLKEINNTLINKNCYKEYINIFCVYSFLFIAYGLTIYKISNNRTQKVLLLIKRNLFVSNKQTVTLTNKIIISTFKFFLNHVLIYKHLAFILKYIKKLHLINHLYYIIFLFYIENYFQ